MGARVIATSSSDQKLARLESFGTDVLINYKAKKQWGTSVLATTNNEGVDHVIEVGGGDTFSESVRATKLGGHNALIGILTGPSAKEIILPRLFLKQIRTSGIAMGNQKSQQAMIDYLEKTDIRPVISHTFSLNDIADGF